MGSDPPLKEIVAAAPDPINAPQVIEFFGLPGIGKTTVAHLVAEGLRQSGLQILASHDAIGDNLSRWNKHFARGRLIMSELPSLFARRSMIGQFTNSGNQRLKARCKSLYNTLTLTAFQQKAKTENQTLLLDQGMAQAAWSVLNFAEGDIAEADPIFPKTNWSPLIICLDAPVNVVVSRIGSRVSRHSRMQSESANWNRAKQAEIAVLTALNKLADAGQVRLSRYEVEEINPEVLAARIVDDILAAP